MFRRNVDFFAVLFIALGLLALSNARSFRVLHAAGPVRFQQTVNARTCRASQVRAEIASRLAHILDQ